WRRTSYWGGGGRSRQGVRPLAGCPGGRGARGHPRAAGPGPGDGPDDGGQPMTNETLATASNYTLYAALAFLAMAMVGFALHLAATATVRAPRREAVPFPAAVGAPDAPPAPAGEPAAPSTGLAERSRRWGVLAMQATWLATFALVASVALRGLSVGRPPVGNMYEFSLVAATFTLLVYAVWSLRSDRLWLGLFVTAPVLLTLGVALVSWYTPAGQLLPSLNSKTWLVVHVAVATLTVGLFTI